MKNPLILFLSFCILLSCNYQQENKKIEQASTQDTLASLQVIVIADLPDSLQPKTMALDNMPKPLTVNVPNKAGGSYSISNAKGEVRTINLEPPVNKMLAVLQNEKGEPILDPEGNPFIMGNGGKSNFTNFTTDNGLALDAISCSLMDAAGNLWFGTDGGGVSRYDGKSFTNFTSAQGLANNSVLSITEDKTGNLWFGTDGGGVSRYDGKSFTNFTSAQGFTNNSVFSITEDKTGNLWFGTDGGGVSRYDGKSFTNFTSAQGLANNSVFSITEDKTGNLWFGTDGGGVSRYDGKSFTNFASAQGLADNRVLSITEDKTGNLWFGTYGGGVSRYDGKSFTNFTSAQGLANNSVLSITEDKTGNLWFGTDGGGVSRYDGKSFTNFTSAQGLAHNSVRSITEDKTGNLWFGTYGGGVSRYDGKSFTNFTSAQGLAHNRVWSITEDKTGNLWFGTYGGGVSRYDGKSFTNFTSAQGLAHNRVWSITEDKTGNLWFGTYGGGVSRYDGKSFTNFTSAQGLANNSVFSITEDKTGNLWFGTDGGGVSRYDGKSFTNFTSAQGLANNSVFSITEDKTGNLWFGTDGGGVSRYDGKSFTNFTSAQGLANNIVFSITEDKTGNLWFGTEEGLSVMLVVEVNKLEENLDIVNGKYISYSNIFKTFTTKDGLPDNFVTNVLQLPDGRMAVGTNLGITFISLSDDLTKLANIEIYNSNTDYPVKDVNVGQNCMLLDNKGIIWAATGSEKTALVRFDYAALRKNKQSPNIVIQSIKVNEENICWYDLTSSKFEVQGSKEELLDSLSIPANVFEEVSTLGKELTEEERDSMRNRFSNIQFDGITKFYPLPENLVLPYQHNNITFDFNAIETDKPNLVNYQYMLEGYGKDWSPVLKKTSASFGNMSEGTYTFKVKAQGPNGVWCEPIVYNFKVLPPWYRTWWAYLIYVLLFLGALRIFSKWREKNLKAEKVKLEKTVEERTKEVVAERNEADKQRKRSEAVNLELKETQSQLVQQEKLASLGALTAGIAHEIKNPLNFVNNFAELSNELIDEMDAAKTEEEKSELLQIIKQNLSKINEHGKRADSIVKNMLEHSRTGTGEKQLTDINKLSEEFLNLAYQGMRANIKDFNCKLEKSLDESLPKLMLVQQDLSSVILNLINNAFYAMKDQADAKLIVSTKTLPKAIEISIKDNGTGMSEKVKQKIFEPFYTTKPSGSGTGLGLSLSFDIIKAHGGKIEVNSEEGKGTEFIITLPV